MSTRYEGASTSGSFLEQHSLSLVLAMLLLAQTVLAIWLGHQVWLEDQAHPSFWIWWAWEYNISIVADTFGVILIVLLSKRLREVGSAEDKGSN